MILLTFKQDLREQITANSHLQTQLDAAKKETAEKGSVSRALTYIQSTWA